MPDSKNIAITKIRVGNGYDVHVLMPGRALILGGVNIPFTSGSLGFSDGDVLLHAIIDSLLGASALGDIGRHFPPGDERYKDISSLLLLKTCKEMLDKEGYCVGNIDSTIICQEPRLAPHIEAMRKNISEALAIPLESVSVKAKTNEKLGYIGHGEGIAAYAVCLLETN